MKAFLTGLVLSTGLFAGSDTTDRPCVTVRIDGRPVRLTIDTGADRLALFSAVADRIGLKYDKREPGSDPSREKAGPVVLFRSDFCRLKIENSDFPRLRIDGAEGRGRVWVAQTPPGFHLPGVDGAIGWPNLCKRILHIDWGRKVLECVPKVPKPAPPWRRLELYSRPDLHVLALRVPASADAREAVYIDTGDSGGVAVCSALWQEIVSQHPSLPVALEGHYIPAAAYVVERICWLETLRLGSLELHDVPVREMPATQQRLPSHLATIGLYGLTRLELIVDGPHKRAYIRTREDYSQQYDYNRTGVVFLPADSESSDLVATVLEGGPAYEAGIRTGDKLLRVNGRDVTGWKTNPQGATERRSAFRQPAGTKLNLMVLRETQTMEMTIVLKELLPVEPAPKGTEESPGPVPLGVRDAEGAS
jgi:hypothetical protein